MLETRVLLGLCLMVASAIAAGGGEPRSQSPDQQVDEFLQLLAESEELDFSKEQADGIKSLIDASPAVRSHIVTNFEDFSDTQQVNIFLWLRFMAPEKIYPDMARFIEKCAMSESIVQTAAILCWLHYDIPGKKSKLEAFISAKEREGVVMAAVQVYLKLFDENPIREPVSRALSDWDSESDRARLAARVAALSKAELRIKAIDVLVQQSKSGYFDSDVNQLHGVLTVLVREDRRASDEFEAYVRRVAQGPASIAQEAAVDYLKHFEK